MSLPSKKKKRVRRAPPGSLPGTLQVDPEAPRPVVHLMAYGPNDLQEISSIEDLDQVKGFIGKFPVTWICVEGLGDEAVLRKLGDIFGIHQLTLEDVVNVYQRPKVEQFDHYEFIVTRIMKRDEKMDTVQLSIILGDGFVVTFQERQENTIGLIQERIRKGRGIIRTAGVDYLTYVMLDTAIDGYFPVMEEYADRMENLENEMVINPGKNIISQLHSIRHDLLSLRRTIWPQRDSLNSLIRESTHFVKDETRTYFRDCYDHTIQIIDFLETYREICSGLMEVYLSTLNLRMQEVVKVLTIISTIFLPLSFITSLYGMNFHDDKSPWNMPELSWHYGYPFSIAMMTVITAGFLFYFWKRGWLSK